MTIDQKHLFLVAHGNYSDDEMTGETWQFGIRLWADDSVPDSTGDLPTTGSYSAADDTGGSGSISIISNWKWETLGSTVIDPIDYLNDQAVPALATFVAGDFISSKCVLQEVRLYPMQGDGKAFEARVAIATIDGGTAGGRSGDMLPPQNSVVCSWRTARPGRRGRGRIYPPPSTVSGVDADGRVNGTMQGDQRDAAVTLLESLAIEAVGAGAPHARPIVTGHPWDKYAVITSVDVGDVVDTQRRRRRQLVETRLSGSPSYG